MLMRIQCLPEEVGESMTAWRLWTEPRGEKGKTLPFFSSGA